MIEIPRDADVSRDLRAVKVIDGVPGLLKGKTNEKGKEQRHGDSAIALVLMWFASLQEASPIEFQIIPRRSHRSGLNNFMRS